jgi:hypothetical protein
VKIGSTEFCGRIFAHTEKRGGIALFLLGYQVVLGVKGARADPRGLRQTLDASAATWT